jgi:hypothetical protein
MQVDASDAHIRVTGGVTNLSQIAPASQCVANKRVSAVMNGESLKAFRSKHFAPGAETLAKGVP